MKFKFFSFVSSLFFISSLSMAMQLASQVNSDVDQSEEEIDPLVKTINATFTDEIRRQIFDTCGQDYLYNELLEKINHAQSYVALMRVQKEIIAAAVYFNHLKLPFDIKGLVKQLKTKKVGDLKRLQLLYDYFNTLLDQQDKRHLDIEHAQGKQIDKLKHDMLWRVIASFQQYNKNNIVLSQAALLFDELCKTVDCNNSYNTNGQSPATKIGTYYYKEGFKAIKILTDHNVEVTKKDRNKKNIFQCVSEDAYAPQGVLSRIISWPIDFFVDQLPKYRFIRKITRKQKN